jgi:hypothetical protein
MFVHRPRVDRRVCVVRSVLVEFKRPSLIDSIKRGCGIAFGTLAQAARIPGLPVGTQNSM